MGEACPAIVGEWTPAQATGRLYVVGGFDGDFLANMEVFDPAWNEWSPGPPMSQRRGGLGLVALRGHLFACGGRDGDIYHSSAECFQLPEAAEPSDGRWHPLPALLRPRCYPAAVRFAEGVWLCGGLTRSSNGTGGYLASTECLALDATSWCRGLGSSFAAAAPKRAHSTLLKCWPAAAAQTSRRFRSSMASAISPRRPW